MTELVLLAKTLTTDYAPVYDEIRDALMGAANHATDYWPLDYDVFLTNVLYTDDDAMQKLLADKLASFPPSPRFFTSMHVLADPILNAETHVMVVDCLNFYVSNILLLYNSDPASEAAMKSYIAQDILRVILALQANQVSIDRLVVLTSDVDFDFYIHTESGKMYRRLIHHANSLFASAADRHGLLTNGTVLWLETA